MFKMGVHLEVVYPARSITQRDLEEFFLLRRKYEEKRLLLKRLLLRGANVEAGIHTATVQRGKLEVL